MTRVPIPGAQPQLRRGLRMAVSLAVMLVAGIIYAWSILKAPLAQEFGWSASQLAFAYTMSLCFYCIGMLAAGLLLKKFQPRTLLLVGAVCMGGGFVSLYWLGALPHLYLAYGLLGGLGSGLAYNTTLSATNAWFPDRTGFATGMQMMTFGLSAFLLGTLADRLINLPAVGWRLTYLAIGIVTAVVLALGSLVVRYPKDEVLPQPVQGKQVQTLEVPDRTSGQMIRRSSFWRAYIMLICMCAVGNVTISIARDLCLSVGAGAALAATLAGLLSVFNGVGRLLCGTMTDKLGDRKSMLLGGVLVMAAPLLTLVSLLTGSLALCVVGLCLVGISYGFCPPSSSAIALHFYGRKNFALNFSVINTQLIPTAFLASLAGVLITNTGSVIAPFIMLVALSVVAMLLNLSLRRP